jgi:hypothetical protein
MFHAKQCLASQLPKGVLTQHLAAFLSCKDAALLHCTCKLFYATVDPWGWTGGSDLLFRLRIDSIFESMPVCSHTIANAAHWHVLQPVLQQIENGKFPLRLPESSAVHNQLKISIVKRDEIRSCAAQQSVQWMLQFLQLYGAVLAQ